MNRWLPLLPLLMLTFAACLGPSSGTPVPPDSSTIDPKNSSGNPSAQTDVLIYNGIGVSTSDWQATENIVQGQGWSYQLVNSTELNAMSLDQIASFGVIVVPGGSGGTIASNLTPAARLNLRKAIRDRGVGYVGFCAGAWVGVGPEALGDATASYGFAIAPGSVLSVYWPGGNSNLTAAMVPVTLASGTTRQLVWWGGPSTPEWTPEQGGSVLGRYATGEPAISQIRSGAGQVIISGPHPEAPQGWRATAGNDPDGLDQFIAAAMMDSARTAIPLAL